MNCTVPAELCAGMEDDDGVTLDTGTMLEHPVYVFWCVACGQEVPEDGPRLCPRCSGRVERHQRVLELADPPAPCARGGGGGLQCLQSLRAALADLSVGEGIGDAAVLLFEQGEDPGVAAACPDLASRLAALGVPPAVQRALVGRGFLSWDQIAVAVANTSDVDALATRLGVASPAAEVLLRRFCNAAAFNSHRLPPKPGHHAEKRPQDEGAELVSLTPTLADGGEEAPMQEDREAAENAKRLCPPREHAEELASPAWQLRWDGQMQAIEDEEAEMAVVPPMQAQS
mmetsp:Transcript_2988/g.7620  ORF Transcript_2988/g.7620 Transcript_2988/m.7620 type:complete len:286 (-) Transcript_2988:100-957(-)